MSWTRRVDVVAMTIVMIGGCSADSGAPQGLPEATNPTAPADEPTATASEPDPAFTQPFVPGEASIIDLPDTLPVEGADDLGAAEQGVVDALGRALAGWDAMLFGADPGRAGLETWFGGVLLGSLVDYSVESVVQQRVMVGSPTRVVLYDVAVDGATATVDVCLHAEDWVEYVHGEASEPVEPVNAYRMPGEVSGDSWRFTDATSIDLPCS